MMRRLVIGTAGLILISCLAAPVCASAQGFSSGYAGSVPTEPALRPRAYFDRPEVRAVLGQLEAGPVSVAQVRLTLDDSDTSLDDLLRTHLLRRDGDRLAIDFAYFSASDMERVHAAVDHYAPSLAQAYAGRRTQFERIFARYDAAGVARSDLAFVVLVGISLNWDGLKETLHGGWRIPLWVEAGQARYSFWASADMGYSYRGFYWGSSSFPSGPYNFTDPPADYTFSSFGDPDSDPRMNFPDLLYLPASAMSPEVRTAAEHVGLRSESLAGATIGDAIGFSAARPIASILFTLRERPRSTRALARRLSAEDAQRLPAILELLETVRYVRRNARGAYQLATPVLDRRDGAMLNDALLLSRTILRDWLAANYLRLRAEVGELTIERHGLTYEAAFTQIWHELFGATSRELVRAGFVSDPRAESAASLGSVSLLWRMSLYDFTPG